MVDTHRLFDCASWWHSVACNTWHLNLTAMTALLTLITAAICMQISGSRSFQSVHESEKMAKMQALKYKDCGGSNSTVRVDHLDVEPSPLEVPGLLRIILRVNISTPPPDKVSVKLILRKRMAGSRWIRIPCIFGFGSCDYEHMPVCLLTHELFECPVKAKYYSIDETYLLKSPETSLSQWLQRGDFQALMKIFHEQTRSQLACLVAQFTIKMA